MAIYRGDGGAGDANTNVTINQVTTKALEAAASATAAAASATEAASSAADAFSENQEAHDQAAAASLSALDAASSATSASGSATLAGSFAAEAGNYKDLAATSEATATYAASQASNSATAAAASESNAASSADGATTSASDSAASESAAATSAAAAASSASNASSSASNASSSASAASSSETAAASSASAASSSASSAASSAIAAASSAASAATGDFALFQSGGTANGVTYLNGSKVLTSGSALTFDGSTVGINTGINTVAQKWQGAGTNFELRVKANDGSASNASAYRLYLDYLNGTAVNGFIDFYRGGGGADGYLAFGASGSEQMRLTSTGLGIGTSSPGAKLHVTSGAGGVQALFSYASGTPTIAVGNSTTNYNMQLGYNVSSEYGYIQATAAVGVADDIVINPNGGNLGLGVTPSAWWSTSKAIQFGDGASIQGRSGSAAFAEIGANVYLNSSASATYIASAAASRYQQSSGAHYWYTAPSGTAGNANSFTQAMTLDASGNLLVGTTSATNSPAHHLIQAGNELNLAASTTSATIYFNYRAGVTTTALRFMNGSSGYVACYGTSFTNSSDYRIKTDVQEVGSVLPKVAQLRPVNYIKEGVDGREFGLIAHEAQAVFPDMVSGEKDAVDEDGDMEIQGIDYAQLSTILVKAIQEQQAIIESLKARLDAANL